MMDELDLEEALGEFRIPVQTELSREVLHVIEQCVAIATESDYWETEVLMELCQPLVVGDCDRLCGSLGETVARL